MKSRQSLDNESSEDESKSDGKLSPKGCKYWKAKIFHNLGISLHL